MSSQQPSNQLSNRSSEEQIRQRIRQQLQQRLPSLAAQLQPGDGSDRNNSLGINAGLQSFGGVPPSQAPDSNNNNADYFNSDSFRATGSHDARLNENQQPAGVFHEDDENYEEEEGAGNQEGSNGGTTQMSPVNMEEFQYQHQLIEELILENKQLREQLEANEAKLRKVEAQLNKTKQWIKELGTIKEDIITLKQSAEDAEQVDKLTTENEILKSQIQDLETRVNTLSRAGDDVRMDEKLRFEKAYKQVNEENRLLTEKYRVSQMHTTRAEEEIIKYKALLSAKDQEITTLQGNWKKLHEDFAHSIKEQRILQAQNEELKKAGRDQQNYGSTKALSGVQKINAKEYSVDDNHIAQNNPVSSQKEFASLRNKSMSGDETQEKWLNQLNEQVDREYSERGVVGQHRHIHDLNHAVRSDQTSQAAAGDSNVEKQKVQSSYGFPQHFRNGGQTYQNNNINVKNFQPVQIIIANQNEQTKELVERLQKAEDYCRELILANKILDLENRTAIAQILHLTDPNNQLQNLTSALAFVGKTKLIYGDKKSNSVGTQKVNSFLKNPNRFSNGKENKVLTVNNAATFKQQTSLKNLQTLRQTGAPPLNQIFQNNNSSFIVQKFNGMQHQTTGDFQQRDTQGRNLMRNQLINYQSSNSQGGGMLGRQSNRDYLNQHQPLSTLENNINNTFSQNQYASQTSNNESHSLGNQRMNPAFIHENALDVSIIDITLNEIQKEINDKNGKQLHIAKVTDGFYRLGKDRIIKLAYDEQSQRIIIQIPIDESHQKMDNQPQYMDFIDFLIEERYIRGANE